MHRQSSRVPQPSQPPPPPKSLQSLPTTPHPASSRPLSSSNPSRMKSRDQENSTGGSTTEVPGVLFPPSLPPSQPMEESLFCGRREPRSLEAAGALTKSIINGDKRCGGAEHDEIVDTPFRLARGREGKIPGADKPEPMEYATEGASCHTGEEGRREGFHRGNEGFDGKEESCEELSLDLSNCSEEVMPHPC